MHLPSAIFAVFLVSLGACSNGDSTPQTVVVRSVPSGATCTVQRGSTLLGTVDPTPGRLPVDFSDKDLVVICSKPGWQPGTATVKAVYHGIGLGALVGGGVAAVVEDAVKSSDFRYDPAGAVVTLMPD